MRLGTRLILGIMAVALLPLLLLALAANRVATQSVTQQVAELHVQRASNLGTFIDTWFAAQIRGLDLVMQAFRLEELGQDELVGFERLVYRQFDDVNIVSLVDPLGREIAPSQFETPQAEPRTPGREAVDPARLGRFLTELPLEKALEKGFALSPPYRPSEESLPVVAVGVASRGSYPCVLGVEFSLATIVARVQGQAEPGFELALLDAMGRFVFRVGPELVHPEPFRVFLGGTPNAELRYRLGSGQKVLAAFSRVESTGWLAVVAEPFDTVEEAGWQIRLRSGYFGIIAAILAGAMGLLFARSIQRPVMQLREAALAVGKGELGRVVEPDDVREFGDLGRAFNEMSLHLRENHEQIQAQRREIESFNQDLQRKVEERTRELKEAQDRLLESGKLAAVAEMGAGLAHELNNPLAGVLGLAQILKARLAGTANESFLSSMETQVQRCADIVRTLLSFTREARAPSSFELVDLHELMLEVSELITGAFHQRRVSFEYQRSAIPLRVRADRASLGRAIAQVIMGLRAILPEGGLLLSSAESRGGELRLNLEPAERPEETGRGPNSKASGAGQDDWFASGMSLWVARRILAEHGGRLIEPEPGAPGRYTVILPEA